MPDLSDPWSWVTMACLAWGYVSWRRADRQYRLLDRTDAAEVRLCSKCGTRTEHVCSWVCIERCPRCDRLGG